MNQNGRADARWNATVQIGAMLVLRLDRLRLVLREPASDESDIDELLQKIETSAGLYVVALSEVLQEVKRIKRERKRARGTVLQK